MEELEKCKKCGTTPNVVAKINYKGIKVYNVICPKCGQSSTEEYKKKDWVLLMWNVKNI